MKLEKKNYKKLSFIFIIIAILILIDQFIKYVVDANLNLYEYHPVLGDVFGIEYCRNEGIAWGMFSGKINFITIFTLVIIVLMIYFIVHIELYISYINNKNIEGNNNSDNVKEIEDLSKRIKIIKIFQYTISVIVAGAIGNLIDRIARKYVIDFLYAKVINFPIFNIADIYVTVAMVLLFVLVLVLLDEKDINSLFKHKKNWK